MALSGTGGRGPDRGESIPSGTHVPVSDYPGRFGGQTTNQGGGTDWGSLLNGAGSVAQAF